MYDPAKGPQSDPTRLATIARAREEQAQATHPVARKVKLNPAKEFREM